MPQRRGMMGVGQVRVGDRVREHLLGGRRRGMGYRTQGGGTGNGSNLWNVNK